MNEVVQSVAPEDMGLLPEMELATLKLICTDENFVLKWINKLRPEHFTHPYAHLIIRAVTTYWNQMRERESETGTPLKRLPEMGTLQQVLRSYLKISDPQQEVFDYAAEMARVKIPDREFLKKRLMDHIKIFDYKQFILEAASAIVKGDFGDIEERLRELQVQHQSSPIVEEYGRESVADRVKKESEGRYAVISKLPTLNQNHGGGFKNGTITLFMGPTGCGKSIMLCNVGAYGMCQHKLETTVADDRGMPAPAPRPLVVYHFTFELSRDETAARYDVILSGHTFKQRTESPEAIDRFMDAERKRGSLGKLYLIELPTGSCSANTVRASLDEHVLLTGDKPDLLILDYITIMTPNNPRHVDMTRTYDKHKVITEEVRALAMELNIPVISAVQSNRGSIEKMNREAGGIQTDDVADSFAVMHVSDLVISINQDDGEKQCKKGRFWVAKARSEKDDYAIAFDIRYDNLRVSEDVNLTAAINDKIAKNARSTSEQTSEDGKAMPVPMGYDPSAVDASLLSMVGVQGRRPGQQSIADAPPELPG